MKYLEEVHLGGNYQIYQSKILPVSSQTFVKMENIPLRDQKILNDCFATAANHLVVEFEIENFGISEFNAKYQKGSHAFITNCLTILQISNVLLVKPELFLLLLEDFWASLFEWSIIKVITVVWSSCMILSLSMIFNICIFNSNKHFRYRNFKFLLIFS